MTFRSHIDGALHDLTPERSIEVQNLLGADIQMQFDECTPFPATFEAAKQFDAAFLALGQSVRWLGVS